MRTAPRKPEASPDNGPLNPSTRRKNLDNSAPKIQNGGTYPYAVIDGKGGGGASKDKPENNLSFNLRREALKVCDAMGEKSLS